MKRGSTVSATAGYRASDSYLRCVRQFALRPLRSEEEYRAAVEWLGRLAARQDLDAGEHDYLAGLSQFVGDYESRKHPIDSGGMKPLDLLRYLMEENEMNTTDLGEILGSRGVASEVLNGKRGLSKAMILRLGERFSVDPGIFLKGD